MVGRKTGTPKTGGRPKGVPNKRTAERAAEIAAAGLTPLDYMLSVLRDASNDPEVRLDAANKAAPYCHPRLSSIEANVTASISQEDALKELE